MNENLLLVLTGLAGCLLGTFFFFGLCWTVRKGILCKRPALFFFGSLLLRTGIVLAGFYLISGGRWKRLLACLLGFVIARFMVTFRVRYQASTRQVRLSGPQGEYPVCPTEEASHAP